MKPLYNDDDGYTKEATEFAEKLRGNLEPILQSYFNQGYDAAHIENLTNGIVSHICTFAAAKRALENRVRSRTPSHYLTPTNGGLT